MARACKPTLSRTNVPRTDRVPGLLTFGAAHPDAVVRVLAALKIGLFGRLNLRSRPTLTRTEPLMALQLGKPKMPASKPRKDEERETRQAIIEDADKTEGKDRVLVHGDGGTLGLGRPEALSDDARVT